MILIEHINKVIEYIYENSNVIVAIISVIGVIITTIIGFIQYKHNKWNEYVSKERTIWLKEFRNEFAIILKGVALCKHHCNCLSRHVNENKANCKDFCDYHQIILNAEEAKYKLYTRINTNNLANNRYNFDYKKLLISLEFNSESIATFNLNKFLELTNLILEDEWKKVKREAKGDNENEEV